MRKKWAALLLLIAIPAWGQAERNVKFTADFESGKLQPNGGNKDSFFVKTLPNPQKGRDVIRTGSGGGAPSSSWDSKVLEELEIGGQKVQPRRGRYFARHVLHYDKDYRDLNDGVKEKARAEFSITHESNRIDFDTEVYAGFSIFVPKTFEHETGTKEYMTDGLIFLNTDASATFITLQVYVPKGKNKAHWFLSYPINANTVKEGGGKVYKVDLGPVEPDIGKWTDFVIRFRSNPFSKDTNPAKQGIKGAFDKLYKGNKGILQVWKAEGPSDGRGNRDMVRKINLVNTPVGNVPGKSNRDSQLAFSMRIYKGNWQRRPTDVKGPIMYGFDEFRFGEVNRHGTTFADVHPGGLDCRNGCVADDKGAPQVPDAPPMPPENVSVAH